MSTFINSLKVKWSYEVVISLINDYWTRNRSFITRKEKLTGEPLVVLCPLIYFHPFLQFMYLFFLWYCPLSSVWILYPFNPPMIHNKCTIFAKSCKIKCMAFFVCFHLINLDIFQCHNSCQYCWNYQMFLLDVKSLLNQVTWLSSGHFTTEQIIKIVKLL